MSGARISSAALAAALAFAPAAARAAAPELPTRDARSVAKQAIKAVATSPTAIKTSCPEYSENARRCAVRWRDGDRAWHGTVYVQRTGAAWSPVDTWDLSARTVKVRGLRTERAKQSGRILVPSRYAAIGQALELRTYSGPDAVVTLGSVSDPFISGDPDYAPPAGTRWIAFSGTVAATNVTTKRLAVTLSLARLVLADGATTVEASIGRPECEGSVDMAPGETRKACALFAVPLGQSWSQVEWSAGPETGVWRP